MKVSRYFYSALLVALLSPVTGCGNDSEDEVVVPPKADAFVAGVQTLAANSPDDTEPIGVDAHVATAPEDT